jgi:hypothetical protein
MENLLWDLSYMFFCWACGIGTGLGLGNAIGIHRAAAAERMKIRQHLEHQRQA